MTTELTEAHDVNPVAAEFVDDEDLECSYPDCENRAAWFVELRKQGGARTGMLCCDRCSRQHAIYANENDLTDHEVSDEVAAELEEMNDG